MKSKNKILKWERGMAAVKRDGKVKCYFVSSTKLNLNPKNWIIKPMEMRRIHDGPDCYPWRKTFAIWPVKTVKGKYVWFKTVYKQKFWAVWGTGFHMEPEVEYAELLDILTEL